MNHDHWIEEHINRTFKDFLSVYRCSYLEPSPLLGRYFECCSTVWVCHILQGLHSHPWGVRIECCGHIFHRVAWTVNCNNPDYVIVISICQQTVVSALNPVWAVPNINKASARISELSREYHLDNRYLNPLTSIPHLDGYVCCANCLAWDPELDISIGISRIICLTCSGKCSISIVKAICSTSVGCHPYDDTLKLTLGTIIPDYYVNNSIRCPVSRNRIRTYRDFRLACIYCNLRNSEIIACVGYWVICVVGNCQRVVNRKHPAEWAVVYCNISLECSCWECYACWSNVIVRICR